MHKPKILSGYNLVEKGFTKIETTLPEIGLKFVQPNNTWLEQKQIQSALDARRHLIEVERIEKSGSLSIAIWKEDLMLAVVTQKVGGYWQHLGHNNGNQLLIYPEEALYLMEVNCLQLMHNNLKVSLQQAYTLLLSEKITLLQYKVYASLSRQGYCLFRHTKSRFTDYEKRINLNNISKQRTNNLPCRVDGNASHEKDIEINIKPIEILGDEHLDNINTVGVFNGGAQTYYETKIQKLKYRKVKPCNNVILKYFDGMPELLGNNSVSLIAPNQKYIPSTINLKQSIYLINLKTLSNKNEQRAAGEIRNLYNIGEEVNGSHVRRINNHPRNSNYWIPPSPNIRYGFQNNDSRFNMPYIPPFNMYFNRPRPNFFCNIDMLQRPYLPQWCNAQQFPFTYNPFYTGNLHMNGASDSLNHNNFANHQQYQSNKSRKRKRWNQRKRLEKIKRLVLKAKPLFTSNTLSNSYHELLLNIINIYNSTFEQNVKLDNNFDLVYDETVVESVVLDDSALTNNKRRKIDKQDEAFDDNLKTLKQLAVQLKTLEINKKATPRHRRAISKALKAFNQSFKVEFNLNNAYEIINSRYIDLVSSSDSNCFVKEDIPKSKQLKNPFNVIKRLSEKANEVYSEAHTSSSQMIGIVNDRKYSDLMTETFTKEWLPKENDFGSAEVVTNNDVIDIRQEEFLYEFYRMQANRYNNWLDLRLSFYNSLKEAMVEFRNRPSAVNREVKSIVKPGDCTDMQSVLKKLRIINTKTNSNKECKLSIDFDVYNKNMKNFKKSDRPIPHFRIVCVKETSDVPSGDEVATLNAEYNDDISVVFAVVGDSISYLQIKPTNLPVYLSNNN